MNRVKCSLIGHRNLPFAHPISEARMDRAIGLLDLRPHHTVVDVGAGRG